MALFRRRTPTRGEETYRSRSVDGRTFHTRRARYGDLSIIVKRFPGPAARPGRSYVLVHGIGVSSRYFHPLAAELSRLGTVYVIDLPGYGLAPDAGRDVSITDHAEVVARFLAGTRIANPVLVGHSMGAQVVSELLWRHPEFSDFMVLLGPTVNPRTRSALQQGALLGLDVLLESLRSNWVVTSDYLLRCGLPYYLRQLPHLVGDRIEARLPEIGTRTLVVRGDRDPIVPRDWALEMVRLLPNAVFAEVPGPHVIMFSAPRQIAALIHQHAQDSDG